MPRPTNTTGVTVNLDVWMLTATSDQSAQQQLMQTVSTAIIGHLTLKANTQSLLPSRALIHTGHQMHKQPSIVNEAAPTASPQPTLTLPPTEMYVIGIGVAIIIVIAIVGALILMAVRKRA